MISGEKKVFIFALAASLCLHAAVFFQTSGFNLNFRDRKKEQAIEVNYVKKALEEERNYRKQQIRPALQQKQEFFELPPRITADNRLPPSYGTRQNISSKNVFDKPAFARPDIVAAKRKISLPAVDIEKGSSPSYISYYQVVREKIRRAAYRNYSRTEVGEAYLSFIITNDGKLEDVVLIDDKSSASRYLKEVALRSVYQAAPFPNFPKQLDYAQLSFKVVISFEIE